MQRNIIVGSGPAAAGAALALSRFSDQEIIVIDIGQGLEDDRREALGRLGREDHERWDDRDLSMISSQPVAQVKGNLPQKRTYGSDYPFRNFGQLNRVTSTYPANADVVSGAYGGFSNVWGAQVMPFSAASFRDWPVAWSVMQEHYRAVLKEVPLAAESDDLEEMFPLLGNAQNLPPLAARSRDVLTRYARNRARVRRHGVTVGRARLAFNAQNCVSCGLCMTGCPYSLIYSSSYTFNALRASGRVQYRKGMLVQHIDEAPSGQVTVTAKNIQSGKATPVTADRVFVGCGGVGTTRLILGSLGREIKKLSLKESVQFVVPFMSRLAAADPRRQTTFTLNQFNMLIDTGGGDGFDLAQVHIYPYNPAFDDALPGILNLRVASVAKTAVLRRISVGLGYLPSWASPEVAVDVTPNVQDPLPVLHLRRSDEDGPTHMYRRVMAQLTRVAPALDLWPVLPATQLSGAAKSYHFGGSFPHSRNGRSDGGVQTDALGRLNRWRNVHLIDASVFPNVPSTTFTLTVMANAHRIASAAIGKPDV